MLSSTATLDPTHLGTNCALSNGNLTVTSSAAANNSTLATIGHSTGKYYCEFTVGQASNASVGIGTSAQSASDYMGSAVASIAFGFGGGWIGGVTGTTTAPALTAAHVYGLAVDLVNKTIWVKDITGAGNWNANGTADPATNTNGADFSGNGTLNGSTIVFVGVTCAGSGDNFTFNFGGSSYSGTSPSGFGNW